MHNQLLSKFRKAYTWFRRSFSRRIMSALLICTSLIILVSSIVYYYSSVRLLKNEYIKANSDLLSEVNQSMQRYLEQLDAVTQSLYSDNTFIDNLVSQKDDYISLAYNEQAIKNILYSNDSIQYIYFYTPYNQTLYSFPRQNVSHYTYPQIEKEAWYQKTIASDHYFYLDPLHTFKNYTNFGSLKNDNVFSANRALRYYVTGDIIGMLSISYTTDYMDKICHNLKSENGYIAVLDENLDSFLNSWPGQSLPDTVKKILEEHPDEEYYTYSYHSQDRILLWTQEENLYILKDIPLKALTRSTVAVLRILIIFSVIVFLISIFVSFLVARSATRNLNTLTRNIADFGNGNLAINASDYGMDEIGTLASAFNEMTDQINELINREYKAQILTKSAELQALQAQIRPHYINNALQAIGTLGLQNRSKEVYFMTNALAKNLRYSLKSTTQLVTLKQEIDNMNDYLYIQKILWDDKLTVDLDVDETLLDMPVPVFILQPLVENSIKHGLDNAQNGHIRIKICTLDTFLSITVQDNGRGIPSASLKMLQEWLSEDKIQIKNDEHVGIRNIYNRILLIYKGKGSFTIDSPPEGGTIIKILLPDRKDISDV